MERESASALVTDPLDLRVPVDALLAATRSSSVQVATWTKGEWRSEAAGLRLDGTQSTVDDLAPGYCMSKIPVIAAVLACEAAGLDLTASARSISGASWVHPEATVLDVLEHRAGLDQPDAVTWRMASRRRRRQLVPTEANPLRFGYSDLASSMVLCRIIERWTDRPCEAAIEDLVLRPADAVELIRYGSSAPTVHPGVSISSHGVSIPLLSERLSDQVEAITPDVGVFASAEGLARILVHLLFTGPGADSIRSRLVDSASTAEASLDPVLGRRAGYCLGLMVNMQAHGVRSSGEHTAGHTSAITNWLAVADLEAAVVRVGYSNGVAGTEDQTIVDRHLLDRVMQGELDLLSADARRQGPESPTSGRVTFFPPSPGNQLAEALSPYVDAPLLPPAVRFSVVLRVDAESVGTRCAFQNGVLAQVQEVDGAGQSDLVVSGTQVQLMRWLENPEDRLGDHLLDGSIVADGDVWALSAFEYWAARAFAAAA